MKAVKWFIALAALCLGAGGALADPGGHHHGGPRVHFGIAIGAGPYWGPWYPHYYYPYYPPPYYGPIVVERSDPPVYIQQQPASAPAAQAPQAGYWYYCVESKGYYPYVKECPGGWQQVQPQAPPR